MSSGLNKASLRHIVIEQSKARMMDLIRESKGASRRRVDPQRRAEIGQEKRARTRSALLETAFELLGRPDGLTTRIEEICATANIARGTFYNYFNSTEALLEALSYDLSHDFNTGVLAACAGMPTAADRSGSAIRYYLERAAQDSKWGWAMVNLSAFGPVFGAETFRQAQLSIEEGIANGEFELTGPLSGRDMVLGTCLAAMRTILTGAAPPTFPVSITRHVLRGMGVPKDRVESIIAQPLPDPAAFLADG